MSPPSLEQRVADDTSFERLYRLHRRDVYGAVLRDLRDPAEAEDVTQIAFLNAFRAMRKGERPEKPRAWLVTIARNVIRRRYRELMRRPQEVGLDPEIAATLAEVDGPTAGEINAAIRRLPPNQRTVILLREIQGHSYAEIAEEMGLSLAAVETLIFRARGNLSEELVLADRVPTTQRRRRGLFFLPLPGLGKLSLGFSLSRAGVAALLGSVAIVTVPLHGGAEPQRPTVLERGPSAAEAGPTVASPSSPAPKPKERNARNKKKGDAGPGGANGSREDSASGDAGVASVVPSITLPEVLETEVPPLPPLPVQPPPLPDVPPLPDLPPLPEVPPPPPLG